MEFDVYTRTIWARRKHVVGDRDPMVDQRDVDALHRRLRDPKSHLTKEGLGLITDTASSYGVGPRSERNGQTG